MEGTDRLSRFTVAVRCRPLSDKERAKQSDSIVHVQERKVVVVCDPGHFATNLLRQQRLQRERRFAFDAAFDEKCTTASIHDACTRQLVDAVLGGFNASIFAYGPTGTGKTYSMLGTKEAPGLMYLMLRDLYTALHARCGQSSATLSYIEIYNETIRDLLSTEAPGDDDDSAPASLELREDPVRGIVVAAVSEHAVPDAEAAMALLLAGNRRRTQEPTAANRESSRSHAVLQITVTSGGAPADGGGHTAGEVRIGKLSMCDLAGSERAANTENRGLRLLEGAAINKSLLALGNCITALVAGRGSFVPYRDSKLTRLLKDSLGGANTQTVMLACISPAAAAHEESVNTLKYANRAKAIRVESVGPPVPNVVRVDAAVSKYEALITGLRSEVADLRARLTSGGAAGLAVSPPQRVQAGASRAGTPLRPASAAVGEGPHARNDTRATASSPPREVVLALRDELVRSYEERMQLRRSLAELAGQQEENEAAVARRRARVERWQAESERDVSGTSAAAAIASELREVARLQAAAGANAKTKASLLERLADSERSCTAVRTKLEALCGGVVVGGGGQPGASGAGVEGSGGAREVLALEYRVHVLELNKVWVAANVRACHADKASISCHEPGLRPLSP